MPEIIFGIWIIGWLALVAVSLAIITFKWRRGTLTDEDVFQHGMGGLLLGLWPLWIVSGAITVVALAAVSVWESRAEGNE